MTVRVGMKAVSTKKPYAVGRVDGKMLTRPISGLDKAVKQRLFFTRSEVDEYLELVGKHDPLGVANGDYYIRPNQ